MSRGFSRLALLLALSLAAADAFANAFVVPHLLEKSGTVANTTFTFDTTIIADYVGGVGACAPGQPCAFVDLYLFDQSTGGILKGANAQDVCGPCNFPLGSGDIGSEPAPRRRIISLDNEITVRGGGFASQNVITGYAIAIVNGDYDNTSITGFVTNAKSNAFDLEVFGFAPSPILAEIPFTPFGPGGAGGGPPPLGASRLLTDIREDRGTVATTNGAYDTSIAIFYLDAWFGAGAPPTGVTLELFDDDGSPMLASNGLPYVFAIADLSILPQPVFLDLEAPLFGGSPPGAAGKRGYANVTITGALPSRVDVTSFVRKAENGTTALADDGFYEQALDAPEPAVGLASLSSCVALLVRRRLV